VKAAQKRRAQWAKANFDSMEAAAKRTWPPMKPM
jgi:hypothetical protein